MVDCGTVFLRICIAVTLAGQIAFWVIFMAGVASSHAECKDLGSSTSERRLMDIMPEQDPVFTSRHLLSSRRLLNARDDVCNNLVAFPWWSVWFHCLCVAWAIVSSFSPTVMKRLHLTITAFFVLSTGLLMVIANTLNDYIYTYETQYKDLNRNPYKDFVSGIKCALAGACGLLIFNFLYIVFITDSTGAGWPLLRGDAGSPAPHDAGPVPSVSTPPKIQELSTVNLSYPMHGTPQYPMHGTPQYPQQGYSPSQPPMAPMQPMQPISMQPLPMQGAPPQQPYQQA